MRIFRSERMIDKGIDVLVVVFGILIALSIDNYRDYRKAEEQWNMFSTQVKADAQFFEKSFTNIESFYAKRFKTTDDWIEKLEKGEAQLKDIEPFLRTLANFQIDYPKNTLFAALIQTGNPFLIDDTDKLHAMGLFYNFEDMALSNMRIMSNHFIPDYMKLLKRFYAQKDDQILKQDIIFLLYSYRRYAAHNQRTYKRQLERTQDLIKIL